MLHHPSTAKSGHQAASGCNPVMAKILEPLARHYAPDETVEIRVNEPETVVVDRRGQAKEQRHDPALTIARIERICRALANTNGMAFDPDARPKVSCVLPDGGHRFEALAGASAEGSVSVSIRCKHPYMPPWAQVAPCPDLGPWFHDYIKGQVEAEANMVFAGTMNTGKTTLLNMALQFHPGSRRIVAVEDTPELEIERFWDAKRLLAPRESGSAAGMVDWRQLYDHITRITPDHVMFGEISTQNAFAALAALSAGATGFMCTIHAESPEQAINRKFEQNIAWAGETMTQVPEFVTEAIDVVVQLKRSMDGFRRVTDIFEPRRGRWVLQNSDVV